MWREWIVGPHDFAVTVYDRQEEARVLTVAAPALRALAWSGDGRRLAIASDDGGLVLDARTGDTVHEHRDAGLDVDDRTGG